MTMTYDLIVIGAGPAGAEAALAASDAGLRVVLIDEGPAPGGQVWRAPRTDGAIQARSRDADKMRGDDLRNRLEKANLDHLSNTQVWDARPGFDISCLSPAGPQRLTAPRVVLATGAMERVRPFPGWTTPGVLGLAAATAIVKAEKMLPGRDIVVAGQGPLLIAVAAKACELGVPPRAVVDLARRRDWMYAATGFLAVPSLLAQGAKWMARLATARVPMHRHSEVVKAEGETVLEAVIIRDNSSGRLSHIPADTLYIGNGLTPADELHRLLGAEQVTDLLHGGYRTLCDEDRRSSVEGLYVAGDGAGVHGALPSVAQGRIAGLAAAHDHGALSHAGFADAADASRRALRSLTRFADASCRLMQFPEASLAAIPEDAIICRCEDVCRGDIDLAIKEGARDLNQLKHFTRLGMGPCQGRMCALNAAGLLKRHLGAAAGSNLRLTPRAPVRPLNMEDLVGEFDYADIPVPKPAPL